jgi:GNAT superfamily N-acetyltransferase
MSVAKVAAVNVIGADALLIADEFTTAVSIRLAKGGDADALTRIAHAAKAYWGYSAQDLERWRNELTFTAESITAMPTWVAELHGSPVAVAQLRRVPRFELECLWVEPSAIRQGVGRLLLSTVVLEAQSAGAQVLWIDADPHAEGFYERLGARRVGETAAPTDADSTRVRPLLVLPLVTSVHT